MARNRRSLELKTKVNFDDAHTLLQKTLAGPDRARILDTVSSAKSFHESMKRLREGMATHVFRAGPARLSLEQVVNHFDRRTRQDGFHVLHDWDGMRDKLNENTIPVDVLNFMLEQPISDERAVLGILLDYYFVYVLALVALRAWDDGNANENLGRVTGLLEELQGPHGSGQRFAGNAETLILIATSHFEPDETAYERLLARIRTLDRTHRENFAFLVAGILASHLRFGFEATYGRDIVAMRKDNGPDYPWLLFAMNTLLEAYQRMRDEDVHGPERERVIEGLVNGLSPDPRAFAGSRPDALAAYGDEHAAFRERFETCRDDLLGELERHRPTTERYSPLAFYFNFLHNIVKGVVVDALLRGKPWRVAVNDLLTGFPRGAAEDSNELLARTLMEHARRSPDRIRGRLVPVIVYDPRKGRRAFSDTLRRIQS